MNKSVLLCIGVIFLLCGCMSTKDLVTQDDLRMGKDEGIVVIGLSRGAKLSFRSGDLKDGKFFADLNFPTGLEGTADDGFIVRKLKVLSNGRAYGLTGIFMNTNFDPKCGENVTTFIVRPGEIQYVKSFTVTQRFRSVEVDVEHDLAGATEFMKENYPSANSTMSEGSVSVATLARCPTPAPGVTIPVYIRTSR